MKIYNVWKWIVGFEKKCDGINVRQDMAEENINELKKNCKRIYAKRENGRLKKKANWASVS